MTKWQLIFYEFIATPAHLWLWVCAKMVGAEFECGPVDEEDYDSEYKYGGPDEGLDWCDECGASLPEWNRCGGNPALGWKPAKKS